jgi:hypothetical protein
VFNILDGKPKTIFSQGETDRDEFLSNIILGDDKLFYMKTDTKKYQQFDFVIEAFKDGKITQIKLLKGLSARVQNLYID